MPWANGKRAKPFFDAYKRKFADPIAKIPDPNLLSAILALRFGESVILLGADALRENWNDAIDNFRKRKLPKARILKIPHHGAKNALTLQKHAVNYLDICSYTSKSKAVIFAGDSKHPDPDVYLRLKNGSHVFCLSNGLMNRQEDNNSLKLNLPGAKSVRPANICNPVVSFEVKETGAVSTLNGMSCDGCVHS